MKKNQVSIFRKKILPALVSLLFSPMVIAAPTGGTFVVGGGAGAGIVLGADTVVTAGTGTNNSVINWGSFNVGGAESVTFQHGGAAHAFINIDQQGSASRIEGLIHGVGSNTSVFVVNPNGVQLSGATINVTGGFKAVAGSISAMPSATGPAGLVTFTGSINNVEVSDGSNVNALGNAEFRGQRVDIAGSQLSISGDLTVSSSETVVTGSQINAGQYFDYSGASSSITESNVDVNDQFYVANLGDVTVVSSNLTTETGHIRLDGYGSVHVLGGSTLESRREAGDDYYDVGIQLSSGGNVVMHDALLKAKAPISLYGGIVDVAGDSSFVSAGSDVLIEGMEGVRIGNASINAGSNIDIRIGQYEVAVQSDITFHGRQEFVAGGDVYIYNASGGNITQEFDLENPEHLGISAGYIDINNESGDISLKRGKIVANENVFIYGRNVTLENSYVESFDAEEGIYLNANDVIYQSPEGKNVSQIAGKKNNINAINVDGAETAEFNVDLVVGDDFPYMDGGPSIEIVAYGDGEIRGTITLEGSTVLKAGEPASDVIVFAVFISDGSSQYGDKPSIEYDFSDEEGNSYTVEEVEAMTGLSIKDLIEFSGLPDETSDVGQYFFEYIGGLEADGYDFFSAGEAQWDVVPRELTISAVGTGKTYGGTDPVLSWLLTDGSLVNGDEFSGQLIRDEGEAVGAYAIRQGTLDAGENYVINFVEADFVIEPPVVAPPPVEPPPVEPPPVEPTPVEPPPVVSEPFVERAVELLVTPFVVFQNMVIKHDDTIVHPEIHANEIRVPAPQALEDIKVKTDTLVEIEK